MLIPPAVHQPAQQTAPKPETGALAKLLATRGVVLSLTRKAVGALYGKGTVELERIEVSNGTESARGLGFHIAGPAKGDGEGRVVVEEEEIPTLLAALDRFQAEAAKLAEGGDGTSFTYTSHAGLSLDLSRQQGDVVFALRAGRGEAELTMSQIAALRSLIEKAK